MMKSALPPLKPTRTSQELSNYNFVDYSQKLALIDKARLTVTTYELNDIIIELQTIYQKDIDALDSFHRSNEIKSGQLQLEQKKFHQLEKDFNTLKSNTSILDIIQSMSNSTTKCMKEDNNLNHESFQNHENYETANKNANHNLNNNVNNNVNNNINHNINNNINHNVNNNINHNLNNNINHNVNNNINHNVNHNLNNNSNKNSNGNSNDSSRSNHNNNNNSTNNNGNDNEEQKNNEKRIKNVLKEKIEVLKKSILEFDSERLVQHPPPMAVDPQTVINKEESDVLKFLHLKELNFREIEALIYLLKKRALSVDQSDESIGKIHKEFTSVSNLIEVAKKLEEENAKLKKFEKTYILDSMTKRRPFAHLSHLGNQSMVLILQSIIDSVYSFSNDLKQPLSKKEGQNFTLVCNDPGFNDEEISFETESNDPTSSSFEEAFEVAQSQYEKLKHSEGLKCQLLPPEFPDFPTAQADKLVKNNADYCEKLRLIQNNFDNFQKEIIEMTKQIISLIDEKRKYEKELSLVISKYKSLKDDHFKIMNMTFNNRETIKTLEKIISISGISLISEPNPIIEAEILKNASTSGSTSTFSLNEQASSLHKKKRKTQTKQISMTKIETLKGSKSIQSINQINLKNHRNKALDILCSSSNDQILAGLEMAMNISDIDQERHPTSFMKSLKMNIQTLKNDFALTLNDLDEFMKSSIFILKSSNAKVLRKRYINKEIQVRLQMRQEKGLQIDENDCKKK
ncbi:hypothetical protein TRFO_15077 [Tritrichomonas foetus]|uniref:Uncharacterized protein n=1 Tax=Tritrichomonas foetus TaxID=1144522 RepID=A0A1J4KTF8_9EUKA|nr:hypothetical protein TRFO_15077 [Tritrichomonas foetus]|eukprot:OHT14539.1 hypothetical protein TRFO_15077 [Tritrichomonas foetus]